MNLSTFVPSEDSPAPVRGRKAKKLQGFEAKPPRCGNCQHFVPPIHGRPCADGFDSLPYTPARCGLGWFIVEPVSICDHWQGKDGSQLEEQKQEEATQ